MVKMTSFRITYRILCLLTCTVLMFVSCSPTAEQPTAKEKTAKANLNDKVEWIDPDKIQPGPIQHDKLSDEQITRIESLHKTFFEVDGQSIDKWTDDFKRDLNPDSELAIWERMAKAYNGYCSQRDLKLDAKKEVYKVILLRSMASQEDVLQRLELKILSKDDAIEIMKDF